MGSVYVPGIIMAGIRQPSVSLRLCWVEEGRGCCKIFRQREMYFIVFVLVFCLMLHSIGVCISTCAI